MNFDKIKTICKKAKHISLFDTEDYQWLGDEFAIYPLYEHPEYNKDTIASVLSLDEKKKAEMIYHIGDMPANIDCSDSNESDKACGVFGINIMCMSRAVIPLMTTEGLKLIETKYITPVINSEFEFYERKMQNGRLFIILKVGFVVEAIITPCNELILTGSLVDDLMSIADGASEAFTQRKIAEYEENK